ncbi:hypothetical protein ABK040_008705 [Willaertia magna]
MSNNDVENGLDVTTNNQNNNGATIVNDELPITRKEINHASDNEVPISKSSTSSSSFTTFFANFSQLAWIWFLLQGISSIFLTLSNKSLSSLYPHPILILTFQNLISVFMFVIFNYLQILPFQTPTVRQYLYLIPTTFFFVLLTWTSIEGLKVVSVPLVVVTRNLVPFLTGIVESTFFGLQLSFISKMSLLAVFFGSLIFSFTDFTLKWNGIHWIILNVLCSVFIPVIEKRIFNNLLKGQTPTGMNFIRNLLSLPMLLLIAPLRGDVRKAVDELFVFDKNVWSQLILTSIFGFTIGLSYFFLLKLVSSTSIAIANTCYKLVTLLLSFIFFGVTFHLHGWIGIILSFTGILVYSIYDEKKKDVTK